ncbi:MAG TPA: glutathione transferase GstA [Caulobacteraceae bacterium]|jgi:glutathione S-transferase|nr:glutathione transferase GstA [Caulobacteraceae bacterium]
MLILYASPGACSLAVHIALLETGLDFELEKVDLKTRRTKTGADYLAVNPKGKVPALRLESGELLTENAVVLQYVADEAPQAELIPPPGSFRRYRAMEGLNFIATEIHKGFGPLFQPDTPEDYKPLVLKTLSERFGYLDRLLDDRPFLLGQAVSVLDFYSFVTGRWARNMKVDLTGCARLPAYWDRIAARPAAQRALRAEGLD